MQKPTVVDLFCGAGGISRGFRDAGFEIILGIDSDEYVASIFKKHFPESKIIVDDIRNLTADTILKKIKRKKVDVLVGGPPCQGFSIAGRRKPSDKRNSLFYEFARIAKELKPSWIFIENVRGFISAKMNDGRGALDSLYEAFSPEFRIRHYIINTADFGVPQKRKRIFLVGNSIGADFDFKMPKRKWKPVNRILLNKNQVDKKYFYSKKRIEGFVRREKRNKKRGLGFRWQFLKMDQPSYTIPARYYKDGANALIKYSENKIRMLTESECAKVQGLDPKLFGKSKNDYKAIGNAVPPPAVQPFAEKILRYGM